MPADATFKRLHDVIQTVTNFSGGYPSDGYHLYKFDLHEEGIIVTNDDEAVEDYKYLKKNKGKIIHSLKQSDSETIFLAKRAAIQESLKTELRGPSGLKIDEYLKTYGIVDYLYDFGDGWQFTVTLEEMVTDYYFGYPTLLEGRETAPPEDVGGLEGFNHFLEGYHDSTHPEHAEMMAWAKTQQFHEYDKDRINAELKFIQYKKTEWDKIDHQNYVINEDKYRGKD